MPAEDLVACGRDELLLGRTEGPSWFTRLDEVMPDTVGRLEENVPVMEPLVLRPPTLAPPLPMGRS